MKANKKIFHQKNNTAPPRELLLNIKPSKLGLSTSFKLNSIGPFL